MNLDIRRHGIEIDEDARARLERRLEFALGRFSHRLGRVTIAIASQLGSRDGSDKICRMLVRLQRVGEVMVEDRDDNLIVLIDRTANRMGQAVRRALGRYESWRHGNGAGR